MAMDVYVCNDKIYFKTDKPEVNALGITDYTDEVWSKIKTIKWNIKFGYYNKKKKLKKHPYIYGRFNGKPVALHRFVMEHWYGSDVVKRAKQDDYVVDHLNNNGLDCQISNLCFIPRILNTSKGNDYDIRRKDVRPRLAINITKDFDTQLFQITMAFNKSPATFYSHGKRIPVSKMYFLYDRFRRALIDANSIIDDVVEDNIVNIQKLNHIDFDYETIKYLYIPPDQAESEFMIGQDGELYMNIDKSKALIRQVSPSQNLYDKYRERQ
ncbi:HNH endonuclease [Bacillus inaquosorum]|uniref:hypothetical protein n=1 Tax=Bacillus inaquosorum TaxID=483913 RepID=UPI00227EA2DD|nr:hypothetical protein [Bacillus inaquosorum]MCY9308687.1 HNH endonuclease [Bacillus inaquosorum]